MARRALRLSRDALLGIIGAVILFHETIFHDGPERISLIGAALALLGSPFFLRADERARAADNGGPDVIAAEVRRHLGDALIRRSIQEHPGKEGADDR